MRKVFIILSMTLIAVIMLLVMAVNVGLLHETDFRVINGDTINYDLLCELRALKDAGDRGAAEDMQQFYPEGYLFFYMLYGLSCSEFAGKVHQKSALYNELHTGAQGAFDHVNSEAGRQIFPDDLSLSHGAFYTGWSMYLLGKKLNIEAPSDRDSAEVSLFKMQCENIARVIQREAYPPSYNRSSWPADAVLCIAALSVHDQVFGEKYGPAIHSWIMQVRNHLDSRGLIPHSVVYGTMDAQEQSRGSSMSLMLTFLWEIDQEFAREQFVLYKENFLTSRLGLPAILEYPRDVNGEGDVDSGPVVFGVGASGTIVAQRTMSLFQANAMANTFQRSVDGFGFPITFDGKKKYLFGVLPMADAFIAWGHSAAPMTPEKDETILWEFHLYSIAVFILLSAIWWWLKLVGPQPQVTLR